MAQIRRFGGRGGLRISPLSQSVARVGKVRRLLKVQYWQGFLRLQAANTVLAFNSLRASEGLKKFGRSLTHQVWVRESCVRWSAVLIFVAVAF